MSMRTKITAKALHQLLFICLVSAAGVVMAGQIDSVNSTTMHTSASTARSVDRPLDSGSPGQTMAQLEMVRENGKRQAAEAAFALGVVAMERMELASAQVLIREALQLQPSNPGYLQAAASLAFRQGAFTEAQAYLLRSLELARASLGPGDVRVAMLMDDLGTIYLAQQRYTQAELTWQESLAIQEQVLGKGHPSIASLLNGLAGLAARDGRFDEAEQLLKRALQILQVDSGTDHLDVATAMHNLADFYVDRHRTSEADALYGDALKVWKTVPSQQRLQIAASLDELGNEYFAQRRMAGAEAQFRLVVGLLEEEFGPDHLYVRRANAALGKLKSEQDRLGERDELNHRMFEELRSQFSQRREVM